MMRVVTVTIVYIINALQIWTVPFIRSQHFKNITSSHTRQKQKKSNTCSRGVGWLGGFVLWSTWRSQCHRPPNLFSRQRREVKTMPKGVFAVQCKGEPWKSKQAGGLWAPRDHDQSCYSHTLSTIFPQPKVGGGDDDDDDAAHSAGVVNPSLKTKKKQKTNNRKNNNNNKKKKQHKKDMMMSKQENCPKKRKEIATSQF